MQIPIFEGVYADNTPDFRSSYPINMVPVAKPTGISAGYLRPAEGIVESATGPGISRGAIFWKNLIYSVMGDQLISYQGVGDVRQIGEITGNKRVRFTYGFTNLAIAADNKLYLYNNTDGLSALPMQPAVRL